MTGMDMTAQEAAALAPFIVLVRRRAGGREFHRPGVVDALYEARQLAPMPELAQAMIRVAEDPVYLTPAAVKLPGAHWRQAGNKVHHPEPERHERCGVCSRARTKCDADPLRTHEFTPDIPPPPSPPEVVEARNAELAELRRKLKAGRRR